MGMERMLDTGNVLRAVSLISGSLIMIAAGNSYMFSTFSKNMQSSLGYTESELAAIPSFACVGSYIGIVLFGFTVHRYGPKVTLLMSGTITTLGFVLMAMANQKKIEHSYYAMTGYYAIALAGNMGGYLSAVVTNVNNFSTKHKGKVTGFLVALFGLSAMILTTLDGLLFTGDDATNTLFLVAGVVGVTFSIGLLCTNTIKFREYTNTEKMEVLDNDGEYQVEHEQSTPPSNDVLPIWGDRCYISLFSSVDFIIIFMYSVLVGGTGITLFNIVSSVADTMNEARTTFGNTVISMSIGNTVGRTLMGIILDVTCKKIGFSAYMLPAALFLCLNFIILTAVNPPVIVSATINGLFYGGVYTVLPVTTNYYFGSKFYSSNLGFVLLGVCVGGTVYGVLSGQLFGIQSTMIDGKLGCKGAKCYRTYFILSAVSCAIAAAFSVYITFRERRRVSKLKRSAKSVES